jgi:hypothetical protein
MIIVITLDMVHHGFNVRSGITEDDAINNIVFHLSLLLLSSGDWSMLMSLFLFVLCKFDI